MRLEPLSLEPVAYVIGAMRDWDRREIYATRNDSDDTLLAQHVLRTGPISWVAGEDLPIACFGCAPLWSGVYSMWFFATDSLDKIGLSVTRMIIRSIVPMMWDLGAHRLECRSMDGHLEAQRWLETLGATREGTLKAYGRGGEDFHTYTWEKP